MGKRARKAASAPWPAAPPSSQEVRTMRELAVVSDACEVDQEFITLIDHINRCLRSPVEIGGPVGPFGASGSLGCCKVRFNKDDWRDYFRNVYSDLERYYSHYTGYAVQMCTASRRRSGELVPSRPVDSFAELLEVAAYHRSRLPLILITVS